MRELQLRLMKATILAVLFFGALGPVFRSDKVADVVGVIAIVLLTGLAARALVWKAAKR